jgi:16S rRNA (guanine527-N7)-methyltransferase
LAESQAKKAAFLREAVRELGIESAKIHAARTEALPADFRFDVVTMRAVDNAGEAYPAAMARVTAGGILLVLEGAEPGRNSVAAIREIPIPNSAGFLRIYPAC